LLRPLARRHFIAATAALGIGAASRFGVANEDDPLPATARLNGWLETRYDYWLGRSPMAQGYLGLKTNTDKWDDIGEARRVEDFERHQKDLADLRTNFQAGALTPEGQLSLRLYDYTGEQSLEDHRWRHHRYTVNQMAGWQQEIPAFLINIHHVESVDDARAYIARLNGIGTLIAQVIEQMRLGEAAGVLAPKFSYANVARDCRNILTGAPFDTRAGSSPIWADFSAKIDRLRADPAVKQKLRGDAVRALVTSVRPAYLNLIAAVEQQHARATTDDGVWKHPDGEAYYASCLARHTTTGMSAADIHAFGLAEVERIHGDMRAIMRAVGFSGDLQAFFNHLKNEPRFYFPQTPEGKAAYIARAEAIIAAMKVRLGEVFVRLPRAKLVVKAVEPFREQSSTTAFYQSPGAYDGRPAIYYVNTFDMKALSKYEMESLAYHEAVPGHHLQIALTQERDDLPRFRRFSNYTAYTEGWGLYSERLPKEMGFYEDPYSDFGRLSAELWRACRLVVDTGIHAAEHRWSRQRAIDYLAAGTPNAMADITNSVERYIVDPGQATAYKIGMQKILDLREDAKVRLGEKFDLRAYHNVVLGNGAVPLTVMAENVEAWVRETQAE
jgi:uncharacterized protein (DUF885 family)